MTKKHNIKNVLYIGNYLENYSRNYIFINNLRNNGINVYEINLQNKGKLEIIKFFIRNFKKLRKKDYDLIIFFSFRFSISFLFAKILSMMRKVPLVNDIFISKLLSFYYDYNLANVRIRNLPKILYWLQYYFFDWIECWLSNYIILDTFSHINYFHKKFNIPIKKFRKVYVGARDDIFYPMEKRKESGDKFIVGFWGTFIPLHGIEYIIRAAKKLEQNHEIEFMLIGTGTTYSRNRKLAEDLQVKNIKFIPKNFLDINEFAKLRELISQFDVGLGIFGITEKSSLAIPNKIFEGIAMNIPMITRDSPAIRELFVNGENICLCLPGNPESLAESILYLKENLQLREKIKREGYKLFKDFCSIKAIGRKLLMTLKNIVN